MNEVLLSNLTAHVPNAPSVPFGSVPVTSTEKRLAFTGQNLGYTAKYGKIGNFILSDTIKAAITKDFTDRIFNEVYNDYLPATSCQDALTKAQQIANDYADVKQQALTNPDYKLYQQAFEKTIDLLNQYLKDMNCSVAVAQAPSQATTTSSAASQQAAALVQSGQNFLQKYKLPLIIGGVIVVGALVYVVVKK